MNLPHEVKAADIYGKHVKEVRSHFRADAEALYALWMNTEMSIVERDRRMAAINASEAAAIDGEGKLYRLNVADPVGWGSAFA